MSTLTLVGVAHTHTGIALSPKLEGTNKIGDINALAEMCAAIDELCHHNKILEDDVHNIRQCNHESNSPNEMEVFDP